jgi:hypothetical protein
MQSRFSFEPRFARLGVVVDTSLTFLTSSGDIRRFQYQDDPDTFVLDPGLGHSVARFVRAGIAHYFSETDYLLMTLCVALVFRPSRGLLPFALALVAAESLALLGSLEMGSPQPGIRGVVGVLVAATTVHGNRSYHRRRRQAGWPGHRRPDRRLRFCGRLAADAAVRRSTPLASVWDSRWAS